MCTCVCVLSVGRLGATRLVVPSIAVLKKEHFSQPPTGGRPSPCTINRGTKPGQRLANGVLEDEDEDEDEDELEEEEH